ncbi:MAG: hypothetical protein JWN98_2532, partial [Abditibacteriota bacterium]|nr:hypothetical protein [Abditibacteriota bacterium]
MLHSSKPRKSDAMSDAVPASAENGATPGAPFTVNEGQGVTAEQLTVPSTAPLNASSAPGTTPGTTYSPATNNAPHGTTSSAIAEAHAAAKPSRVVPKTAFGYAILVIVAALGALVAWRTMGTTNFSGGARMAGAGGALAAAATCMFIVNLSGGRDRSWQTPWIIVAAALLCRVVWEFLGLSAKAGSQRPPSDVLLVPYGTLLVGGVGLWTWQRLNQSTLAATDDRDGQDSTRRGAQILWLIDGLLIGLAAAIAFWWLTVAPTLATIVKNPDARPSLIALATLAFDFSALAMTLMAWYSMRGSKSSTSQLISAIPSASTPQPNSSRFDIALPAAALSILLFMVVDHRLMGAMRSSTMIDLALRFLAPLGLGIAALQQAGRSLSVAPLAAQGQSEAAAGQSGTSRHNRVARMGPLMGAAVSSTIAANNTAWISGVRQFAIVALPTLAILIMTWRLSSPSLRPAIFSTAPGVIWWAPGLLLVLVVRYALAQRDVSEGTMNSGQLQQQVTTLKRIVDHRTFQLSTLHTVTAELSNSQGCEQILTTAIERTLAALGAHVGGIWLNIDASELNTADGPKTIQAGESSSRTVSNATFVWRELERAGTERLALQGLRARAEQAPDAAQSTSGRPALSKKRWNLVLSRGDENPPALLAQLHTRLESENGLESFEQLGQTDGSVPQRGSQTQSLAGLMTFAHVAPIRSKGELLGALGVVREGAPLDASERSLVTALALEVAAALQNVQLYQEASRLADRDSLTDLLNHRAIQQQLNAVLSRAQRSESELAVVMMDLNNFKFFNDTYGHPEGDRVLKIVAQCLREACRGGDIIGRFGGDEFIALLIDTDTQGALHVCQRIAARVEEEGYQQRGDKRRIPIGLSFGASIYPHDGTTAMELLTVADANLYEAKRGGAPMMIKRSDAGESQELRKLKDAGTGGSFGVLDAL